VVNDALAALYPWGKDPPVPIVYEAAWELEPVWTQRLEEIMFVSARD
jgi:precorrin-4 methylase